LPTNLTNDTNGEEAKVGLFVQFVRFVGNHFKRRRRSNLVGFREGWSQIWFRIWWQGVVGRMFMSQIKKLFTLFTWTVNVHGSVRQ